MKIYILLFMGALCPSLAYTQTIKVVDNLSLQPVQGVAIHSTLPSVSVVTNTKGQADLNAFSGSDSIWFSHVSYETKVFSFEEIKSANFKISMNGKMIPLGEIMISANKFEEKAEDVAQPVQVMTSKELEFINQSTTADVLQSSGNIVIQKSQLGGGSPIIRGFETNKVLMVVDGVRMNNSIYRGGHLQNIITLDNTLMDKVEIMFGPGSVVYGSDALGGVMHFYTKNPMLADSGMLVQANAFMRFGTAAKEKTGHVNFTLAGNKFGSITSFTYSDFDDLRMGENRNPFYGDWGKRPWYVERVNNVDSVFENSNDNVQKQSGYKQYDLLQKFLFKQSDKVSHILNIQYSTSSDIPRYDRLVQESGGDPRFAEWYYGPQERLMTSYALVLNNDKGFYDSGRITLGYQQIEESRHDRRYRNDNISHRTENVDVLTLNADFAKKIKKNEIRYGFDGWYNTVDSKATQENIVTGESEPTDTRYPDGGSTMQNVALYASHSLEINEKLILNDGIRFSNVNLHSEFDDTTFFPFPFTEVDQNNSAVNGNLGLIYMPSEGWRFTVLGSSGFRAPNVDDLSKVFESSPGSVVVPNPDLGPEYTYNAEVGISKTWSDNITIGGTGFHTWYVDAITTQPGTFNGEDSIYYGGDLSEVTMNVNAAEAYLYGFNAYFAADITKHFTLSSTLNFTFGRIRTDSTDYPLDHIPPVFGKTSFNLHFNKFQSEFFIMYNGAKNSKDYNLNGEDNQAYSADPENGYMPAWYTLNVRAGYQFTRNIQLQLALENILDQHYRTYASNISSPGRNFVATLRGTF